MGSCGIAAGALDVWDAVKSESENIGIDIDTQVTGCVGMYHHEPSMDIIENDGRTYTYGSVNPDNARDIMQAHIAGQGPLEKHTVSSNEAVNEFLKQQDNEKYVVCNADEGDPHVVLAGMAWLATPLVREQV